MPYRKRPATAPGRRPGELRRLVPIAGLATAAVVVISSIDAGLPAGRTAAAVVVLTVLALTLWCAALLRGIRGPRLLAAALVGTGLAGAALDVLRPSGPGFVLAYMAMAGLGLGLPRRPALTCGAVVVAATGAAEAVTSEHPVSAGLTLAAGAGALFLATALAGASRDAHAQAEALLAQEAATRAAREEAAVLGERQRLAHELHDVLAHTLSGLAVQLEGARLLADRTGADPRLAEQVANAQRLARDGMTNAKRAVATLRGEALPGPSDLPGLVEQARLAGLPANLTVVGPPRPVPVETGLAIYRAVQEALTNATKHAGRGAIVDVTLTWTDAELAAEIVDRGGDHLTAGLPSGGYGLSGLAERAALAGGHLDAGPTAEGWRVALTMPLPHDLPVPEPQEVIP